LRTVREQVTQRSNGTERLDTQLDDTRWSKHCQSEALLE
jgi:hypothetical protein